MHRQKTLPIFCMMLLVNRSKKTFLCYWKWEPFSNYNSIQLYYSVVQKQDNHCMNFRRFSS